MNFGKLVWIEGARLYLQVDAALLLLEPVTLKVDLSPAPGTALIEAEVARVLPGTANEPQGYLLRTLRVAADDLPRWQQFLLHKRKGGTLSDLSDVRDGTTALRSSYTSVAERERRAALERMSAKGPAPLADRASTWSQPSSSQTQGNRAAMRDALRAAMTGTASPSPPPAPAAPASLASVPPRPGPGLASASTHATSYVQTTHSREPAPRSLPPRSVPPNSDARSMGPSPRYTPPAPAPGGSYAPPGRVVATNSVAPTSVAPGTAPAEDPTWVASPAGGSTYLLVTWKSELAYSYDIHSQLASGVLTLATDGRPLPAGAVTMVLRYQAMVIQSPAHAIRTLPLATTYRLDLTPAQLVDLRRMARDPSTPPG